MPFVGIASNVSLIVASLDLQVVRLLRAAIKNADAASSPARHTGLAPAATFERRRVIHPEPRYEPRRVIHPTPRFEPRPVERTQKACADLLPPCSATCAPEASHITKSPIEPPWKKLPWENPPSPPRVIKVIIRKSDIASKGSIIDCFI
jgi:hypothetical protein